MARPTPTYTPVRNYAIGFSLSLLLLFSDINYGTFTPLRGFLHASTLYAQMISKGVFENISMTLTSIQKNKSLIQENKELRDQILQIRTKDFIFRKNNETNTQIFLDLGASLVLFLLIYLFRRNSIKFKSTASADVLNRFIRIKKWMSTILVPIIITLASYHFISWISGLYDSQWANTQMISINNIFFDELFQLLIIVDVLLLLFSFFNSELFHKIMRNSGFIISTILIRVSFFTDGISNIILIISSLIFGLLILLVYNECEKRELFKS